MLIFRKEQDIKAYLNRQKQENSPIGFVPTMGALHQGHLSLIKEAKRFHGLVVCSIFINPTQFNDKEDYLRYPVTIEKDIQMMLNAGCDVAFIPDIEEMYPQGTATYNAIELGGLETILEGKYRPGHFKGVGQIVTRLLDIVQPTHLFLGQKDYQQVMAIRHLLEETEIGEGVQIIICPTVREADGLAMSSRNIRLTDPQRVLAGTVYQCLVSIQSKAQTSEFSVVRKECFDLLEEKGFVPEYIALADADDFSQLEDFDTSRRMIALIAAKIGEVRLIDNLLLQPVEATVSTPA